VASTSVTLWSADNQIVVADTVSDPGVITARALQLRERERTQVATNFAAGNYEVASTYVWTRTMALLKKQLGSLGPEFIGDSYSGQRSMNFTDIPTAISDSEAISLALDLGIFSPLQTKRLFHSQEIVTYFAGLSSDSGGHDDEVHDEQEAILVCEFAFKAYWGKTTLKRLKTSKDFATNWTAETLWRIVLSSRDCEHLPISSQRTAISVFYRCSSRRKVCTARARRTQCMLIIHEFWPP
jgi:hypothetical protein